jgi:hypothetical protein
MRMARYPGGLLGRLDTLLHHPRMAWVPRPLTSWVCDRMDLRLGVTREQLRQERPNAGPSGNAYRIWDATPTTSGTATVGEIRWLHEDGP